MCLNSSLGKRIWPYIYLLWPEKPQGYNLGNLLFYFVEHQWSSTRPLQFVTNFVEFWYLPRYLLASSLCLHLGALDNLIASGRVLQWDLLYPDTGEEAHLVISSSKIVPLNIGTSANIACTLQTDWAKTSISPWSLLRRMTSTGDNWTIRALVFGPLR